MPDLLPYQDEAIANARLEWFLANQKTWVCAGCHERVVEYAPEHAGDPCDHTAYCAGCVREHVAIAGEPEDKPGHWTYVAMAAGFDDVGDELAAGVGLDSYAAHVAAGTLR